MSVSIVELEELGHASGLDGLGVCSAESFESTRIEIMDRIGAGFAGKLKFTYADPVKSTDVRSTFPWAERLVVGVRSYLPDAGSPGPEDGATGRTARFSVSDYYQPLRSGLTAVGERLQANGYRAEILSDDNRLVDRAAAVRAGVGWWGKNTMVLNPKYGPWFLIGSVVTDAPLEISEPMRRDCGTCSACLPACPTGALVAPGVLDASRCLAHWAQVPGVFPIEFRAPMGDRIYGCDDCLDACPPGKQLVAVSSEPRGRIDLAWLLSASNGELLAEFDRFYIPRRDPAYLRRNALVAAGNTRNPLLLDIVESYLGHRQWLLRAHAVWAFAQLGGDRGVLVDLHRVEHHDAVLNELKLCGIA